MTLPPHLEERAHPLNERTIDPGGEFVLCWLHHAIRDHENPAIDASIELGNALGRPVLVYQGLAGRHRFNSDRHHAFILQGARDLQAGLAARGVAYVLHLPRDPATPSPLHRLLRSACAFVTEDFPAPPFPAWTARLAEAAPCVAVAVDAACVMPVRRLGRRFTRAFRFRQAAKAEWASRLRTPWIDASSDADAWPVDTRRLGFEPLDLSSADIGELCASCDIDHTIPPVARAVGGSAAGYARWRAFRDRGLRRYNARRNDAADMDAVSCLSPYLHHGHVSPFRIAREARETGGGGADKFLDELLVWRELAFNFCVHTPPEELEALAALPDWARETLEEHAGDARGAVFSWESLARAATGDALWDAAQRSLTVNGELHNNLRMTWGKMIPKWTASPAAALRVLIDLNHRYALDGSDPNSYGGLLWCLGQFDRPFPPGRPVLGTVRDRSTEVHAERLDPARYGAAVRGRSPASSIRVAVIGGGVAGLACARVIRDQGSEAVVFDRGRRPGGRMSSRRTVDGWSFDHGAPFFEVRDRRFEAYASSWIEDGVCAEWPASYAVHAGGRTGPAARRRLIVGAPGMDAVVAHLARDLDVRTGCVVDGVTRSGSGWRVAGEAYGGEAFAEGPFDALVVAAPTAQASRLIGGFSEDGAAACAGVTHRPTWVLMLGLGGPAGGVPEVVEFADDAAIALGVRDDAKPGRFAGPGSRWVVHATHDWSAERYDLTREEAALALTSAAQRVLGSIGVDAAPIEHASAHRWGLAHPARTATAACFFDRGAGLGVCGDGWGGVGVESAFLSGCAAAGRVLSMRPARREPEGSDRELPLFAGRGDD